MGFFWQQTLFFASLIERHLLLFESQAQKSFLLSSDEQLDSDWPWQSRSWQQMASVTVPSQLYLLSCVLSSTQSVESWIAKPDVAKNAIKMAEKYNIFQTDLCLRRGVKSEWKKNVFLLKMLRTLLKISKRETEIVEPGFFKRAFIISVFPICFSSWARKTQLHFYWKNSWAHLSAQRSFFKEMSRFCDYFGKFRRV